MIDLTLIQTFLEVVKTKSLSVASQNLNITQSAVSQRVKTLESFVGESLFYRMRSGMKLNSRGKDFFDHCIELETNISNLNNWVLQQKQQVSGILRISSIAGFHVVVMPSFLGQFSKKYPNIRVEIQTGITSEAEERVLNGDVDVGIIVGQCKKDSLKTIFLSDDSVHMVCSPDYFLAQKKKVTRKDLNQAQIVWHADPKSRTMTKIIEKLGLEKDIAMRGIGASDMLSAKEYAIQGLGVAFVSLNYLKDDLKQKRIVVLPGFKLKTSLYLISRNEKYESPAITAFKKEFYDYFQKQRS